MGALLLEGGAEFGGAMREPDLRAIELAGGQDAPIRIIPTAAAPDKNHLRAGNNGIRWFHSLGATNVESTLLIDEEHANDSEIVESLRAAKLIYMLGGFTHYLGQTLLGSQAWKAVLGAWQDGAVIAGSSAGAMVMCEYYFDPGRGKVEKGLNLVPNTCVLPHHNTFGKGWVERLRLLLPGVVLLGIDEFTGMIMKNREWEVLGSGAVTVYHGRDVEVYGSGQRFMLD